MTSNQQQRRDPDRARLLRDQRGRKGSNPWRCLWRLRFGAYAIIVLLLVAGIEGLACEIFPTPDSGGCATLGPWLSWLAIGVLLMSVVACASQGLHDFHKRQRRERRF